MSNLPAPTNPVTLLDLMGEYKDGKYTLAFDPQRECRSDRLKMITAYPFFGQMILRLEPIILAPDNPYVQTAATDGRRIYYNPVFMHLLGQEQRIFVHMHEVMHVIVDTIGRMGNRDPSLWNAASDYAINQILQDNGAKLPTNEDLQKGIRKLNEDYGVDQAKIEAYLKEHNMPAAEVGKVFVLIHPDFKGKCSEEIYELLQQQEDEIDKKLAQKYGQPKDQGDDGDDDDGEGQGGDQEGDGDGDQEGDGNGKPSNKQGKGKGGKQKDNRPGTQAEREKMRKYAIGSLDQHPLQGMSKEDLDRIKQDIKAAMNEARTMSRGDTPAGMDRMFNEINNTKIKWYDKLSADLMDFKDADYSWETPNSYFFGQGMTLPGMKYENTIRIRFIVDTSGSISEADLRKALGEMWGITRQFDAFNLKVTCFDTKMYDVIEYTDENADQVKKHPFKGGGGTHFGEAFAWLMEDTDDYDAVIFFTDGYGDGWYEDCASKIREKMFWLITENYGNAPVPSWGRTIYYDRYE